MAAPPGRGTPICTRAQEQPGESADGNGAQDVVRSKKQRQNQKQKPWGRGKRPCQTRQLHGRYFDGRFKDGSRSSSCAPADKRRIRQPPNCARRSNQSK